MNQIAIGNRNAIEPIQIILTRINGHYYTFADMNSAYNQKPLDEHSCRLTQFVIGKQQLEIQRLLSGLSMRPAHFSAFIRTNFRPLIVSKNMNTYLTMFSYNHKENEKNVQSYRQIPPIHVRKRNKTERFWSF